MNGEDDADKDRREFLEKCGRFAAITPPSIVALLSTTLTSDAVAHSGGGISRDHGGHRHDHHHKHRD